jgi:hypothetical protein
MTITINDGPVSVRGVLFPGGDDGLPPELDGGLTSTVTAIDWSRLGGATVAAVRSDVVDAVHALLEVSLGDILLAGWRAHGALKAAAERSLQTGVAETVELLKHRIEHEASPHVEVMLDGVEVGRLTLTITADVEVSVVSARVEMARLVALHSGDATLTISLDFAGRTVAKSDPHQLHLPLDVSLGDGVLLIEPPTAPSPSTSAGYPE